MDADLSHPPDFVERALAAGREQADVTIASRYVRRRPRGHGPLSLRAQPDPECRVLARARRADQGPVERVPPVSQRGDPRAAHHQPGLRRPAADRRAGVRRRAGACAKCRSTTGRASRQLQRRVLPRRHGLAEARSASCGCSATRSSPPTTTTAPTTAASRCSATGSARVIGTSWTSSPARVRCSTSAAARAGSSQGLPPGSVAVDVLHRKLRYARRFGKPLVRGSGFALPFPDASFPCVLCSQVIEHVPEGVAHPRRAVPRARARRPSRPRHAGLRELAVGLHREAVRHWCRAATRTSTSPTTPTASSSASWASAACGLEEERYILRGELIQAFRKPR